MLYGEGVKEDRLQPWEKKKKEFVYQPQKANLFYTVLQSVSLSVGYSFLMGAQCEKWTDWSVCVRVCVRLAQKLHMMERCVYTGMEVMMSAMF